MTATSPHILDPVTRVGILQERALPSKSCSSYCYSLQCIGALKGCSSEKTFTTLAMDVQQHDTCSFLY